MNTRCHTFTGQGFDPLNPRAEDVRLEDIAHHLAMTCRFGGACPVFYSVAQHAVRVAELVEEATGNPEMTLLALHHDSAEAYVHDIRRPIKHRLLIMGGGPHGHNCSFELVEMDVLQAIAKGLALPEADATDELRIDTADVAMLRAELVGLFGASRDSSAIPPVRPEDCMPWQEAKATFMLMHERLVADIAAGAGKAVQG